MKKNTGAGWIAMGMVGLYLIWNWGLSVVFGYNAHTALAALVGVYVIYDINTRK